MTALLASGADLDAGGWTAERYRTLLGWRVSADNGHTLLALGAGMVALSLPRPVAVPTAERMLDVDAAGPILGVDFPRPHWLFFADANGDVSAGRDLPEGAALLGCPRQVALPSDATPSHGLFWVVPPDEERRWLPTLATVVHTTREVRTGARPR